MKMLICVVQDNDVNALMEGLIEAEFRVTKLSSTGGFLRSGNTTLFLGVEDDKVSQALAIIDKNCKRRKTMTTMMNPNVEGGIYQSFPIEIEVGGATVFQIDVEQLHRL